MDKQKAGVAVNLRKVTSPKFYEKSLSRFIDQSTFLEKDVETIFRKEVSFAVQLINNNGYLAECDPSSFLQVIVNVAQTGLSLNPTLGHAYIVPRWDAKAQLLKACLDPGYRGYIHLMIGGGYVLSIDVQLIHENDEVMIDLASDKKIVRHIPGPFNGRGKVVGVYSNARLKTGGYHCELMDRDQVEAVRETSQSYQKAKDKSKTIWAQHEGEMFRKTVLRRQWKYLYKGSDDTVTRSVNAIELDDSLHGKVFPATEEQRYFAFNLLETAQLTGPMIDNFHQQIENAEFGYEMTQIIEELKECQPAAVNPSKDEINRQVRERVARDKDPENFEEAEEVKDEIPDEDESQEREEIEDYNDLEKMVQACDTIEELEALYKEGVSDGIREDQVFQAMVKRKKLELKPKTKKENDKRNS